MGAPHAYHPLDAGAANADGQACTDGRSGPGRRGEGSRHERLDTLNHIGVEVDDLDDVEARCVAAGLKPFNHADFEPGRRFYFFDPDGIEYEVISYR